MRSARRSSWLWLSFALLLPTIAVALDSGFTPPLAVFYRSDFPAAATPAVPVFWEINTGNWRAANGTFNSRDATARTAIATIAEYFTDPNGPPSNLPELFTYRARMLNQGSADTSLVGVVFSYVSDLNYNEIVFSPTGTATLRQVRGGIPSTVISTSYTGGGRGVWFDVEVERSQQATTFKVNGIAILRLQQSFSGGGRVGLVTHDTTARFDKVSVAFPFGTQPFKEPFKLGLKQRWQTTGQWSLGGGTFNSAVAMVTTAHPVGTGTAILPETSSAYTFRARMLNSYGNTGNLVGIRFNIGEDLDTGSPGYAEVVFSPRGVAKLTSFYEGTSHTVATAPYSGRRNVWFDVRLDATFGGVAAVAVDGVEIFKNVSTWPVAVGDVALVTHWAPGKFDDVWHDNYAIFMPLSATFDGALPTGWAISGTWNTNGGTLNDTSVHSTDIVATNCGCWDTDISYRARLFNEYGNRGNLVGLVYNYQRVDQQSRVQTGETKYQGLYAGDYYEVVFAPTGEAYMNQVLNGVRYPVATSSHPIPSDTWFDVELLRQGTITTVKVNGATIFDKVKQAQPAFGDVGVVTHWAKAHFDDLTITDAPMR